MIETSRHSDVAIPDADLWEGPWRLSEEELRLHAGERQAEWRMGYWEVEE